MARVTTLTRPKGEPIIQVHSGRLPRSSTLLPIQLRFFPFRTIEKGRFRLKVAVVCRVLWSDVAPEPYRDLSRFFVFLRSKTIRMNRNLTLLTALGAGLALAPFALAQAPAAAPAPAAVAPVAMDAKIALVNFEQVVLASNEGQVVTANTQKKFEPQKNEIEKLAADVDTMKKQQAAATTDEAKAKLLREIDLKEKALNSRAEEAQTAYNAEWQEGLAGVAQKIAATMKKYAADSGFTLLLDVSSQQSNVLWAVPQTDISQAVVDLYNKQSGIAAPVVQAPRAAAPKPTTAAPKPAAPAAKPPVK